MSNALILPFVSSSSSRALSFAFDGVAFSCAFSCAIHKVDRTRLYGSVEIEAHDESGQPCHLATLADDGQTLIPPGGIALAYLSPNGMWREKGKLRAVDPDGKPLPVVESSFKGTTALSRRVSHEEYLSHNIRLAYELETVSGGIPPELMEELRRGAVFAFPFSYRGGLESDTGFLLADPAGNPWMTVGKPAPVSFVGFEEPEGLEAAGEPELEEEEAELEFGF